MNARSTTRPALTGLMALLLLACTPELHVAPESACRDLRWDGEAARRNVILIVNDTMRRDRIGVYGGDLETPNMDDFAEGAIRFDRAYAQSPWTKASVASLFTSLYPSQHGLSFPNLGAPGQAQPEVVETDILSDDFATLAETLRDAGYTTAAFVSNPWMKPEFGFGQGFDVFEAGFAGWDTPGDEVTAAASNWLAAQSGPAPFLLYVHYMDSHHPYPGLSDAEIETIAASARPGDAPLPIRAQRMIANMVHTEDGRPAVGPGVQPLLGLLRRAYDKGVERFDVVLASLLTALRAHPDYEQSAIVLTSDHGEALYEHGHTNHGRGLYDEEVAVPLLARLPGVGVDGPVQCAVGLVDLMPTLCAYLGVDCPEDVAGVSILRTPGEEAPPPRYLVSEGVGKHPKHRAIRNRSLKLIWQPDGRSDGEVAARPYSLYDVERDPLEEHDLLSDASSSAEHALEVMVEELARAVPSVPAPDRVVVPVDDDTRRRLEDLGYLGSDAAP